MPIDHSPEHFNPARNITILPSSVFHESSFEKSHPSASHLYARSLWANMQNIATEGWGTYKEL